MYMWKVFLSRRVIKSFPSLSCRKVRFCFQCQNSEAMYIMRIHTCVQQGKVIGCVCPYYIIIEMSVPQNDNAAIKAFKRGILSLNYPTTFAIPGQHDKQLLWLQNLFFLPSLKVNPAPPPSNCS